MDVLFHRFAADRVSAALKDTPVVMVIGPRQCGKTTLVRDLVTGERAYRLGMIVFRKTVCSSSTSASARSATARSAVGRGATRPRVG